MNYTKRTDDIYLEIECFQDYELTQCVAYEMMVRNGEVNALLVRQNELVAQYGEEYFRSYKEADPHIEEFFEILYKLDSLGYTFKDDRTDYLFNLDADGIRNLRSSSGFLRSKNTISNGNAVTITDIEGMANSEGFEDDNVDTRQQLILKTSRPMLHFEKQSLNEIKIDINLNFPKDELIAYITKMKEVYDEESKKIKGNIIKAPMELLGKELEKADNLICDTKGKCFDVRETLSKQQKLADMFYIYDCLQQNMTQRKIQHEVYNYYADKNIETKTLDPKTLKKYKDIAIDYIENKRYKELITGVKV